SWRPTQKLRCAPNRPVRSFLLLRTLRTGYISGVKLFSVFQLLAAFSFALVQSSNVHAQTAGETFAKLAEDYINDYLWWRPQAATTLGFHQFDGNVTDFRRASLDAELARLRSFDQRLNELDPHQLNPQDYYDYRILRGAIKREIFAFDQMQI